MGHLQDLREGTKYELRRAGHAIRGTVDFANNWGWAVGTVVLWLILAGYGYTMIVPNGPGGVLVLTGLTLAATWLLVVIFRFMFVSPRQMHRAVWDELRRFQPKLKLSFTKQTGVVRLDFGSVSEVMTGRRFRVASHYESVLRVLCTNESGRRCEGCRAHLTDVKAVGPDGSLRDIGFIEPVELQWSRELADPEFVTALEPAIPRAIYVLTRRKHPALMLYRETKKLPFEYAGLFEEDGKYRLWIQVNGPDESGDVICIDAWPINTDAPPWSIGVEVISSGTLRPIIGSPSEPQIPHPDSL